MTRLQKIKSCVRELVRFHSVRCQAERDVKRKQEEINKLKAMTNNEYKILKKADNIAVLKKEEKGE